MKPESLAIKRVRDGLARFGADFELEKTHNSYASGWLDLYVEAPGGFVGWIEAKYLPSKHAVGGAVPTAPAIKKCSSLQLRRFKRHMSNDVPALLLCGFAGLGPRHRTYVVFAPQLFDNDLVWPDKVKVLDLDATVAYLINWTRPFFASKETVRK